MVSFFRYPGGKSKLRGRITSQLRILAQQRDLEYREPFFGGGSIGLYFIQKCSPQCVWLNDRDIGIAALWTSVIRYPHLLKSLIRAFVPSIEKFDTFKSALIALPNLQTREEVVYYGFMKLAIHQISYSGLGTVSGGPLGGRKEANIAGRGTTQEVKYPIDCRWSPEYICRKIDRLSDMLNQCTIRWNECTSHDFTEVIDDTRTPALLYLDPPYFKKGNDLYQYGLTIDDHRRLAEALKNTHHQWVLSYDDCPEIRNLYQWANIEEISAVNYSITALKDKETGNRLTRNKKEILISPKCQTVTEKEWAYVFPTENPSTANYQTIL